jgi:hypothetical protein
MNQVKSIFLLVLVLSGSQFLKAQEWAPVGAKWTYTLSFATSGDIDTLLIRSISDTIIQGKQCKILRKTTGVCDDRGIKEYMYSDSGKVYFFDDSRLRFQMLFNINAVTNDSWIWYPNDLPYQDSIVVKVDSVSTMSINSIILKVVFVKYTFSSSWQPTGNGKIIENLGDTYYMFPWVFGACDMMFGGPLRCYEDSIIGHYETGVVPTCNYKNVGINEETKTNNEFKIYPNPFINSFTLEKLNEGFSNNDYFEIVNLLGERIFYSGFSKMILTTDLYDKPDGIYFMRIHTNGSNSYYKIVKQ